MAFTSTSEINLYNPELEGLQKDDLVRRGLAAAAGGGSAQGGPDLANKAFGGPQYIFKGQTTAAESGSFTLNLATATRSLSDPQATPTLPITRTLGPLSGALTTGIGRLVRFRVTSTTGAGAKNVWEATVLVQGGATPTVVAGPGSAAANAAPIGLKLQANDAVTLTAGASSLVCTISSGTAATILWTVEVFANDPS